ncbi:MAG: hypothetical protein RLZZ511_1385 [Cyanobacteriota bacterium]|jgi:Conserved TM helix
MYSLSPLPETVASRLAALPEALSPGYLLLALDTNAIVKDGLPIALRILGAILILILGWILSGLISAIVGKLLDRTTIDEQIGRFMSRSGSRSQFRVDNIVVMLTRWLVKILAIVAALDVLQLQVVSTPLNALLTSVFEFLPRIALAVGLVGLAWLAATLLKGAAMQVADSFELDARINSASGDSPVALTETLGNALYWFVFLFFLPLILGTLGLGEGPLAPVQNLLTGLLSAIPQILTAMFVGAVGWFIAQILRNIVTNLLAASGIDRLGQQVGISRAATGQSLSDLGGLITYIFALVWAIIAALKELDISAISDPATLMLSQFITTIPLILGAAVILTVAYFIGKLLADLAATLLAGLGFDNVVGKMGLTVAEGAKKPSQIVGTIVFVSTVLVALIPAVGLLKLEGLETLVLSLLQMAGQVAVGVAIFGAGLFIANWAAELIRSSGMRESNLLATSAKIAIWIFSGAMALRQIGAATDIVNLTFGLLLGALAVALAIAFGLGGRDVAAEQLRDWVKPFKR